MAEGIGRRELLRLAGIMGLGAFSMSLTPQALAAVRAKHIVTKHLARKSGGGKNAAATATGRHAAVKHVVVLDAGHGGCDPGCIGCSGVYEKHVTIETVREIARQLAATGQFRPVLTRNQDVFIPLHERVALARAARGDLFLSIHADAIPDHNVRGASVFTLSDHATDKAAALLAQKENHADVVGGINLASQNKEVGSILLDLAKRQTANLSLGLAKELVGKLSTNRVQMLAHSHRSAGFAVLRAPDIPSALVELGCLSNKQEDKLLRTAIYQKKLATSIVQSVQAYYSQVVQV